MIKGMKPRIFIVEDDKSISGLLREALQIAGFEAEVFDLGGKAIETLQEVREGTKEKPNLILLDLILPDMNGIEVLKEARKYPQTKSVKIYALTNYSNPDFNEELVKEGIDKILIKVQYTLEQLVKAVKEATKSEAE
jgi:two-component system cell cycle response regulator DivK